MPQRSLWSKLAPFAVCVLAINLLANLFGLVDRYMIVHYSGGTAEEALAIVGQYHSSRVVPLLLVSITTLLATILTPHLSHDWESGRRRRVSIRLNVFLKLSAFALTAVSVAVLFAAPLLFDVALGGKFSDGRAVLPLTLTYCAWFSMLLVAQRYLWCAEKAGLASLALLAGLLLNIGLNRLLLPRFGLSGAVLATAVANLAALTLIVWFARLAGFRANLGTWAVLALPAAVCLGPAGAALLLIVFAWGALRSRWMLSQEERELLAEGVLRCRERLRSWRPLRQAIEPGGTR
jgi:O-antigen/teichoic acid export membrane protein